MTTTAPQTLREFNNLLEQAGLPRLSAQQFASLREAKPRSQLVSAVTSMLTDRNARLYVEKALKEVGATAVRRAAPRSDSQTHPDFAETAAMPQQSDTAPPAPPADSGRSDFEYTMHVYGGKAALCFEPTTTRGDDFTVALDSATASAPRQYDWQNKLRLQLTRDELPVVAGVLLGLIPRCEYTNHGPGNDKGFSIEDQGTKLFVRTWAKDHPARAVPMTPEDAYRIATLFLRQLGLNAPWMSANDIIQTIRMVVARRVTQTQ